MRKPSTDTLRLHPLPGCKPTDGHLTSKSLCRRLASFMPTCVFVFIFMLIAAGANATIVPKEKCDIRLKTNADGSKYISIYCQWTDLTKFDYPEIVEFPRTFYVADEKKSYPVKHAGIHVGNTVKKVIFHDGITNGSVTYQNSTRALESIVFENSNAIANLECFNNGTLKEVVLPKNIENVNLSFNSKLESVTIAEGCTSIPHDFCQRCGKITEITLPSTIKTIERDAFSWSSLQKINIPEGVTSLGKSCFDHSSLREIVLPEGLTTIPNKAFYSCKSLRTVTMSDNVTSIGEYAFAECDALTTLKMPSAIETIGSSAFKSCTYWEYGEKEMKMPNIKSIGSDAFYFCIKLNCDFTIPHLWDKLPQGTFTNTQFNTLTLSEGITSIDNMAFWGCKIDVCNLPKSLKEIGYGAFQQGYTRIVNFAPGTSIESLGNYIFEKCSKLEEVNNLPQNLKTIPDYMFNGCSELKSLVLPEGLTTIGTEAFKNCQKLVSLNIPTSVTTIGKDAFYRCSKWEGEVSLPLVTELPENAFTWCKMLRKMSLGPQLKTIRSSALDGCSGLTELILPNGLETIEVDAFYNCSSLTEVVIPESVTTIGAELFGLCKSLKKVTLPSGMTEIPNKLFSGCEALTDVAIPANVKSFGNRVFYDCKALERMTICDGVTIGTALFYGCEALKEVRLPSTLTTIPESTFRDCVSLKKVELPTGLTAIESYAFENSGIEEMVIPETVKKLASSFTNCKSLKRFVFPKDMETIENGMLNGCEMLADITLPTNLKTIGSYAFENTLFDKSELPATVSSIGYYAFAHCTQIKEMFIPEGVTVIPQALFMSCTSLKRVVLPSTVTELSGREIFKDCPLTDIVCHAPTAPDADISAFDNNHYSTTRLIVPEGSNYKDKYPWSRFNQKTEGEGFITLNNPVFSKESCTYTEPITVTITNPNATGTLYYKLVPDGTAKDEVSYAVYTEPLNISEQSVTIYAYIVDGINSSEYAKSVYTYKAPVIRKVSLEICGMMVDEKNCNDVLGDKGSVVYDPKSEVLTLTWATIDATKYKERYSAINGGGGDLTIRVVGHCTLKSNGYGINYGVFGLEGGGGNLTIVGDENSMLNIELSDDSADGIYSYLGNLTIDNCAVIINGGWSGVFMKYGMEGEDGVFTIKGENALLNTTGKQAAMMNIGTLVLDKNLAIVVPEGGVFFEHAIFLGDEMQKHAVIRSITNEDVVNVPVTRGEYDSNFSNTLVDEKTGEPSTLENVVLDNVFFNVIPDNGDGYDATEQCVVLNTTMDINVMNNRVPTEVNSYEVFADWYNGMTMVLSGKGTLNIDCKTVGAARLGIKIGVGDCQFYTANERNTIEVSYELPTPQYVYIFAAPESSETPEKPGEKPDPSKDPDIKKAPSSVKADKSCLLVYKLSVSQTHAYIGMGEYCMYSTYTPMVNINLSEQTDIEAFAVQVMDEGLKINKITGKVPAGTPMLIRRMGKPEAGTKTLAVPLATGAMDIMPENDLVSATSIMRAADLAKANGYILEAEAGFFTKVEADDATVVVRKGEAYLLVSNTKAPYAFNLSDATGIDATTWADGKKPVIHTLQGVRVTAPTAPGIYIVNGKKKIVK